ncbi:MAG: DUF6261 family protein [Cytophagales bacterium]|nr:DUF6261 family protein [Cytophagales bacterium]
MLEKLRTSLLLPAELADTTTRYKQTLIDQGILPGETEPPATIEPFIERIFTLLDEDLTQMSTVLTAVRQNQLVTELAKADAIRDDLFIGFRDLVDASKRRQQTEIQESWQLVWPVIKSAGTRLYTLGYAAQSGRLEALFEKLDQADYQTAMTTLNATTIYAELKQAQSDFITIHDQRLAEDLTKQYPTLRDAKAQMVKHLNGLLEAVDILGETETENYTAVIDKMNVITNSIMSTARARRTRNTESSEEFSSTNTPEETVLAAS